MRAEMKGMDEGLWISNGDVRWTRIKGNRYEGIDEERGMDE